MAEPSHKLVLDESFDAGFCRPLARPIARAASKTPLTPNQLTLIATFFGVLGGALFALPGLWPAVGAAIYLGMMVLDCADGELARLRGGGSWRGRVLDGIGDLTSATAIHVGMLVHLSLYPPDVMGTTLHPVVVFSIEVLVALSIVWSSMILDGVKQRLKPASIDRDVASYRAEVKGPVDRFLYWFLVNYVVKIDRAGGGEKYASYPLFRMVQWVGPTHHNLWAVIAGLAMPFLPHAYFAYFAFAIVPANLFLLLALRRARSTFRQHALAS